MRGLDFCGNTSQDPVWTPEDYCGWTTLARKRLLLTKNPPWSKFSKLLSSKCDCVCGQCFASHFAATKRTQVGSVASVRTFPVGVNFPVAESTRKITMLAESWLAAKR